MPGLDGFVWAVKPKGWRPMPFLAAAKRALGSIKAGYSGALDPFAWGLMPICVGRGCRFSDYLLLLPKTYVAMVAFGYQTDTWDGTGNVVSQTDRRPSLKAIERGLEHLVGEVDHPVPSLSSKKVSGRPLYDLFYAGQPVQGLTAKVSVYDVQVLWYNDPQSVDKVMLLFQVSKGTYIRGLVHFLGQNIGTPCTVTELVRTKIGDVSLVQGVNIDRMTQADVVKVDEALGFLPKLHLNERQYMSLRQTGKLELEHEYEFSLTRVYATTGFVGVGKHCRGWLTMKSWL